MRLRWGSLVIFVCVLVITLPISTAETLKMTPPEEGSSDCFERGGNCTTTDYVCSGTKNGRADDACCPKDTVWDLGEGLCIPRCVDSDNDGFGAYESPDCQFNALDCDDNDASVNPFIIEKCNDKDDNCDGVVDEGCFEESEQIIDPVNNTTDIMPNDVSTPVIQDCLTEEICDGQDNDCDGRVDEGCVYTNTGCVFCNDVLSKYSKLCTKKECEELSLGIECTHEKSFPFGKCISKTIVIPIANESEGPYVKIEVDSSPPTKTLELGIIAETTGVIGIVAGYFLAVAATTTIASVIAGAVFFGGIAAAVIGIGGIVMGLLVKDKEQDKKTFEELDLAWTTSNPLAGLAFSGKMSFDALTKDNMSIDDAKEIAENTNAVYDLAVASKIPVRLSEKSKLATWFTKTYKSITKDKAEKELNDSDPTTYYNNHYNLTDFFNLVRGGESNE